MRGNLIMDHTAVVRDKMTERYLLNELDSDLRDQFEEHYFDCQECALDVSAGAQFVEQSKLILAERSEPILIRSTPAPRPVSRGWLDWFRPAFAAPALALLLLVAGYQNLVTLPGLRAALKQPQVLPAVSVNMGTWGAGGSPTPVPAGQGLLLFLRIPPDASYARYTVDLFGPNGKSAGSFSIAPAAGQDQWPVMVPKIDRETGAYTMAVHGITTGGESKDLGSTSFQLQIQR
jgi:hypothetical protein